LKASPSLNGVVIDKKLFTRILKDKRKRSQDKEAIMELEDSYDLKFERLNVCLGREIILHLEW
jgi:DNA-directed RNA polymerase subunit beta